MTEADLTDVAGRSDATMAGPPPPASPTALDLIDVDVVESYPVASGDLEVTDPPAPVRAGPAAAAA